MPIDKKKFSRKELKKPDEFISRSTEIGELLTVHRRKIIIGTAALLGGLLLAAGIYVWMEERDIRSSKGMVEAIQILERPVSSVQFFGGAEEMDDEDTFGSQREKDEAAAKAFRQATESAATRSVKNLARLGEAQALLGLGRNDEAAKAYKALADDPKGIEPFLFLVYEGLGFSLEAQGSLDDALKQYRTLEAVGEGKYESLALYHQARILEAQGKKDEAKGIYQRLAATISKAPKMTPMLGYLQDRIAGREGVPAMPGSTGGEPGMILGPDGQMIPTPGAGSGLSPEDLERLKKALENIEKEQAGKEGAGTAPEGGKAQ